MTTRWLNPTQAAEHSGYGIDVIYDALRAGELRGYRRSDRGRWRISEHDVDAWVRGEEPPIVEVPRLTRAV